MSKMKTFRGKLEDHTQHRIHLSGGNPDFGYRIVKFQVIGKNEDTDYETAVQIFKSDPGGFGTATANIDFDNDSLIAACLYNDSTSGGVEAAQIVVFDDEVVNQDLFITMDGAQTSGATINYHIVMEEVKMSDSEAAVVNYKASLLHG